MKRFFVQAFAILVVSGALIFSQPSGNPPTTSQIVSDLVSRLTTLLSLSTAQQTQATTIFTTEFTATSSLRTSMQSARSALETAITSNDSAAIAAQASQIGSLTAQQVQVQATAAAAFYAILTPDQQTKFTQLKDMGLGLTGGPGFGGPSLGGPGPGRH